MTGPKSLEEEIAELESRREGRRRTGSHESRADGKGEISNGRRLIPVIRRSDPVHRPAVADLSLHHQVEDRRRRSPVGDEKLLDELHDAARRLDDRLCSIERIMTAENPNWRQQCLPGRDRPSGCWPTESKMARRPQTIRRLDQAAAEPHALLSRQAQRQGHRRLRRHRRLYRASTSTLVRIVHGRGGVPEQRIDPPVLFYRRAGSRRTSRASSPSPTVRTAQFWQGVRASPARTARDIRCRFKDIDRRLADIESYVTTENRSLAREIDQLR